MKPFLSALARCSFAALALAVLLSLARPAAAYVEIPYTLGRLIQESTHIMTVQVEKVDKDKNLIIYKKIKDLKGVHPTDVIRHNIGQSGFEPREWKTVMAWAEPGRTGVFFHNGSASETCINNYWYQAYPGGEWWNMSHAEPYLLRTFAGSPDKLPGLVTAMLAGQEVVVPCMLDNDKQQLKLATAKVQRLRASMKLQDYNPARDFVGWGGDDFRNVLGLPGFARLANISRVDPEARAVVVAPAAAKTNPLCCFVGEGRVSVVQINGPALHELSLPFAGGARAAAWADYNRDGLPDLLLATAKGPKLFTNLGESFRDDTPGLPTAGYQHTTAAAWLDANADGLPDMLLADGFRGLRLYKNLGPDAVKNFAGPRISPWYYAGPFDNSGQQGFAAVYPPEAAAVDLKAEYTGKGARKFGWKEGKFTDGEVNNLAILEDNNDVAVYLYREFTLPGAAEIPVSLGSDDTLTVWLNGEKLVAANEYRACAPDQHVLTLKMKPGKNTLLLKVCQGSGEFAFYYAAKSAPVQTPPLFADASEALGLGPKGLAGSLKGDQLVVADVNADGREDFLFCAGKGIVALNTPRGFSEPKNSSLHFQPGRIAPVLADLNGDKTLDLFVPQDGGCQVYAGRGDGTFVNVTAQMGDLAKPIPKATSAFAVDFRGTGKPDLFVGCLKGPNRYFKSEAGKFVDASDELGFNSRVFNTRGLSVADVNGDGALDLLLNNEGQESSLVLGLAKEPAASKVGANK